jgi:D-amino peptidase
VKRFLLCADVEGASGVGNAGMLREDTFHKVREMITSDINACVRGIRRSEPNATIDLFDAHGLGGNVIEEKLQQDVRLLGGGWIATLFPLASSGQLGEYDGLFLLGQHAANGTKNGFLSHTNSKHTALRVNGRDAGEAEQLAWLAGAHGVPTLLVVGDDATQREANALLPGVRTVSVKCAVDRQTAECRPVDEVWREIESAASNAVSNLSSAAPSIVDEPVQITVFLSQPTMSKPAEAFRDASVDARGIVRFESSTFIDGWFQYQTIGRVCSEFGLYKETYRRLCEHPVTKEIASEVIAEFNDSVYREDSPIPDVRY